MIATEMYDSVTNGGASNFAEVVAVLNRYKPWCVIGGLAVNCYVEPVYTVDVDLVVVAANLERIGRELELAGFRVEKFEHSMNAQRSGSKLNVQFTTDPRYQKFLDGATEHEVLGMPVPVANLKDIVRSKVWAWQDEQRRSTKRKKDELESYADCRSAPRIAPVDSSRNREAIMSVVSESVGRARVSRARECVLAIANFSSRAFLFNPAFGATPLQRMRSNGQAFKPARETRALPRGAICALVVALLCSANPTPFFAQADPASEPAVLAVAKVLPAVVNINSERVVKRTVRDPFDDVYSQFFGYRFRPREVRQTLQSLGSGFIIDPAGYIITNQHVVERAADLKIHVTAHDGKTYRAHYIAGDDKTDLAFIKIDAQTDFPFINLDDISPNLLGQTVMVVGNAVGYGSSISRGVLSAVKRNITVDETEYKDLVQTDAAINPGNSGGPVVDLTGRLVGIASAKMAFTPQGVPTQGLGFAIPADVVRDSVNRFKQIAMKQGKLNGSPAPAETSSVRVEKLFGMQLQDLSSELSDALGYLRGRGVLITAVEPDSPADDAGIRRGMVLYRINKSAASSVRQVDEVLRTVESGADVEFTIGIIRARGENHELAALTLKAR